MLQKCLCISFKVKSGQSSGCRVIRDGLTEGVLQQATPPWASRASGGLKTAPSSILSPAPSLTLAHSPENKGNQAQGARGHLCADSRSHPHGSSSENTGVPSSLLTVNLLISCLQAEPTTATCHSAHRFPLLPWQLWLCRVSLAFPLRLMLATPCPWEPTSASTRCPSTFHQSPGLTLEAPQGVVLASQKPMAQQGFACEHSPNTSRASREPVPPLPKPQGSRKKKVRNVIELSKVHQNNYTHGAP